MKVVFINCCREKESYKCPAKILYKSRHFKRQLNMVKKSFDENHIFILSAKYGIVGLNDIIEPYDLKLTKQTENAWAEMVFKQAEERDIDLKNAVYYCSPTYYGSIERKINVELNCPFRGLDLYEMTAKNFIYDKETVINALKTNKKPERMSSTYWSKLKRGLVGKCYGIKVTKNTNKNLKQENLF